MPIVKSVGGMSAESPMSAWTGLPDGLADQVVQGDVDRALRGAVAADGPVEGREMRASPSPPDAVR